MSVQQNQSKNLSETLLEQEKALGMDTLNYYSDFAKKVSEIKPLC